MGTAPRHVYDLRVLHRRATDRGRAPSREEDAREAFRRRARRQVQPGVQRLRRGARRRVQVLRRARTSARRYGDARRVRQGERQRCGLLGQPDHRREKKKDVLAKLGKEAGFHAFTGNFLNLLVDKRRENQIEAIIAEFETLFCEATDTQVATVTSAVKLENEQQFMIAKKLQEMTGAKNIKLKPEVDESLLGGFVVQYGKDGSGFIDMSVRGQVDKLASVFVKKANTSSI